MRTAISAVSLLPKAADRSRHFNRVSAPRDMRIIISRQSLWVNLKISRRWREVCLFDGPCSLSALCTQPKIRPSLVLLKWSVRIVHTANEIDPRQSPMSRLRVLTVNFYISFNNHA